MLKMQAMRIELMRVSPAEKFAKKLKSAALNHSATLAFQVLKIPRFDIRL
jgi:hypothetical protein